MVPLLRKPKWFAGHDLGHPGRRGDTDSTQLNPGLRVISMDVLSPTFTTLAVARPISFLVPEV